MTGSTAPRLSSVQRRTIFTIAAAAAFIGAVAFVAVPRRAPSIDGPNGLGRGGPGSTAGANPEAAEQQETTDRRNEAFAAARSQGKTGQVRPKAAVAASGWFGEQPYDTVWDDWEPAIAADPHASYVYALVTRYGAPKPCSGNCPSPFIAL